MADEQGTGKGKRVFRGADDKYYIEDTPGGGPRHHDDLPVTPESVRQAAMSSGLDEEVKAALAEGAAGVIPVTMLLAVATLTTRQEGAGGIESVYLPEDHEAAYGHAKRVHGVVVGLAVLQDFRG